MRLFLLFKVTCRQAQSENGEHIGNNEGLGGPHGLVQSTLQLRDRSFFIFRQNISWSGLLND